MRRKNKQDKLQPKLAEWVAADHPNPQKMTQASRREQLDKEIAKLLKLRREAENRRQQEDKIIKKIIRLQIDDDKNSVAIVPEQEQDQEYLILTTESSLSTVESPSMLKLSLADYGEIFFGKQHTYNQAANHSKEESGQQDEGHIGVDEVSVKEWKENGSIDPQFLTGYSNDFLQFLQQMQYTANTAQTTHSTI